MKLLVYILLSVVAIVWATPLMEEIPPHYDESLGTDVRVRNMETRCFDVPSRATGIQILSQHARVDITGFPKEKCTGKKKDFPSGYYGFEETVTFPSESVASVRIKYKYGDKKSPQDEFDVAWKWDFRDDPEFFPLIHEFDHGRTVNEHFTLLKCPNGRKDIALTSPTDVSDGEEVTVVVSSLFAPSFLPPEGVSYGETTYRGNVIVKDGIVRVPIDEITIENPIVFISVIGGSEMTLLSPLQDPLTAVMALEGLENHTTIKPLEGLYGTCPIVVKTSFNSSSSENRTNIRSDRLIISVREDEILTKPLFPGKDSVSETDSKSDFSYVLFWNSVRDLLPFRMTGVISENVFRPSSVNSNTPIYLNPDDPQQVLISKNDLEKDFGTLCMKWNVGAEQNDLGPTAYCQIFSEILSAPIAWSPNRAMDDEGNVLSRICLHDNMPESSRFAMVICRPNGSESSLTLSEPDLRTQFANKGLTVQKQTVIPVSAAQNYGLLEDDRYYNGPYGPEAFIFILVELSAPKMPKNLEYTLKGSAVCNFHDKCSHSIGYQVDNALLIPKMVLANLYTDVMTDQESILNLLINVSIELNQKISGLSVELHVILNEDEDDRTRNILTRDIETREKITQGVMDNAGLYRPLEWTLDSIRSDSSVAVFLDPSMNNLDSGHTVTTNDNLHPYEVVENGRKGMLPGEKSIFASSEFWENEVFFVSAVPYWTDSDQKGKYSAQMANIPFSPPDIEFDWITIDKQTTFKLKVSKVIGTTVRFQCSESRDGLNGNELRDLLAVNNKTFQKTIPAPFFGEGYVLFEIVDSLTGRSYRIVEEVHITNFDLSHQYVALPSNKILEVPTSGKYWKNLGVAFDTEKPPREEDYSIGSASSQGNTLKIEGISLVDIPRDTEVPLVIQHNKHNYWTVIGKPAIEFSDDNPSPDNAFYFYYTNSDERFTVTIDTSYTPAPSVQVIVTTPNMCKKGKGLYPAETHTLVKKNSDQQLCMFSKYGAQSVPIPEAAVQDMNKVVTDYDLKTTYPYSVEQGTISGGITLANQDCVFDTLSSTIAKEVSNVEYKFCYKVEEPNRRVTTTFWETDRPNQFTAKDNHEFTTHTTLDTYSTLLSEDAPSEIEFGFGECSTEIETYSLSNRDSAKAYFSLIEHGLTTPNQKFPICLKSDWQYWTLNGPVENLLDEDFHIVKLAKVTYNFIKNVFKATFANKSVICDNCEVGLSFEGPCTEGNVQFKRNYDANEIETISWPVQMDEFLYENTFICINDEEGDMQTISLPPTHSTVFQDKTEEGIVTLLHDTGNKSTVTISAGDHSSCNNVTYWPTQGTKKHGVTTFSINETPGPVCARVLKEIEGETIVETVFDANIQYYNHNISDSGTYYLSHSDITFKSDMFTPLKVGLVSATETCTVDAPVRDDAVLSYEAGKMVATFDTLPHWEDQNLAKLCIWQSPRNVVGVIVAYTNFSDPFYRFEANVEHYDVDDQHMKLNIENINVMDPECVAWLGVSCTLGELEEMGTTPVPLPQSSYEHELTFEGVSYDSALGLCIKGDGVIRKMSLRMPTNNSFKLYWLENVLNAHFNHGIQTDLTSVEVEHDMNIGDTVFIQNISNAERENTVLIGQNFTPSLSNREVSFGQDVIQDAKYAWIISKQDPCAYSEKQRVPNVTQHGEYWHAAVDIRGIDGEIGVCVANSKFNNFASVHGLRSKILNSDDNANVEAGKDFIVHYQEEDTVINITDEGKDLLNDVMINGQKIANNMVILPSGTESIEFSSDGSSAPVSVGLPPKATPKLLSHSEANLLTISVSLDEDGVIAYALNKSCESKNKLFIQYASVQGERAFVNIDPEKNDKVCFQHISQKDHTISEIGVFDVPFVCPATAKAEVRNENELFVDVPFAKVGTKAFLITDEKQRCSAEEFEEIDDNTTDDDKGVKVKASKNFGYLKKGDAADICFLQSPNSTALISVDITKSYASSNTSSGIFGTSIGLGSLIIGGVVVLVIVVAVAIIVWLRKEHYI